MKIKHIFGYIIKFIHFLYAVFITIGPYITNNIEVLLFLILNNTGILLLWYLFDDCWLTDIENYLFDVKIEKNKPILSFMSKNFISNFGEKSKTILTAIYTIPFVNTCVCAYKIRYAKCEVIPNIPS
jgi:hypothetical protein